MMASQGFSRVSVRGPVGFVCCRAPPASEAADPIHPASFSRVSRHAPSLSLRPNVLGLWARVACQAALRALLRRFGNRREIGKPRHGGMLPDLNDGLQLGTLLDAAQANNDGRGVLGLSGEKGRSALGTENLRTRIAALCHLDVAFGLTVEHEAFDGRRGHCSKRRARQDLAVRAMADRHPRRVDLCRERDGTAMTGAVDVHDDLRMVKKRPHGAGRSSKRTAAAGRAENQNVMKARC